MKEVNIEKKKTTGKMYLVISGIADEPLKNAYAYSIIWLSFVW